MLFDDRCMDHRGCQGYRRQVADSSHDEAHKTDLGGGGQAEACNAGPKKPQRQCDDPNRCGESVGDETHTDDRTQPETADEYPSK